MKKKVLSIICSAALCMGSFGLAACGGSSSSEAPATTEEAKTPEAKTPEKKADPAETFVGSWKMAAAEAAGMTIAGDFAQMLDTSGKGVLTINADGTGSVELFDDDPNTFTWTVKSDDVLDVKLDVSSDDSDDESEVDFSTTITSENDALFMVVQRDDQKMTFIYTADGTYADAKVISMDNAVAAKSADQIVGTWTLCGLNMAGVSLYGDADVIAEQMGGQDISMTFKAEGTVDAAGVESSWAQSDDGFVLTTQSLSGDTTIPIMFDGDEMLLDFSESMGGMTFIEVFAKK